MDALRAEVDRGPGGGTASAGGSAIASAAQTESLEIAFAIGAGVLTLGILLIAAAMLVRNNVSLARGGAGPRQRGGDPAGDAGNGARRRRLFHRRRAALRLQCQISSALLDLPDAWRDRLADHACRTARGRRQRRRSDFLAAPADGAPDVPHLAWAGRELDIYKAPVADRRLPDRGGGRHRAHARRRPWCARPRRWKPSAI